MNALRLRRVASFLVIAATAGTAVAIGSHPSPGRAPTPPVADARTPAFPSGLIAREARAAARLRLAERRLRTMAAGARASAATSVVPLPPIVAIAPAAAPVTRSASS